MRAIVIRLLLAFLTISFASHTHAGELEKKRTGFSPYKIVDKLKQYNQIRESHWDGGSFKKDVCYKYLMRLSAILGLPIEMVDALPPMSACNAELFEINWNNDAVPDAVIRLGAQGYLFLLFASDKSISNNRLLFMGYAQAFSKYDSSAPRVGSMGGQSFLIVNESSGGSGVHAISENWFLFLNKKADIAFSFPTEGREYWDYLYRKWNGSLGHSSSQSDEITIDLTVSYFLENTGQTEDVLLFEKKQRLSYHWVPTDGKFVFDKELSSVSESELQAVYDYDHLTRKQMIQYNLAELSMLTQSSDRRQKTWLKEFLDNVDDIPEKNTLIRELGKQ